MKRKITLLFILVTTINSYSQDFLPIHSQYLLGNYFLINPAVAGINSNHRLRLTYRNQWIGEPSSPNTITASYQGRLNRYLGVGGYIFKDRNGNHNTTGFELATSYQINLGTNNKYERYWSLGLAFSGRHNGLDLEREGNDPALINFNEGFDFGFNLGSYFIYENYYGGLAISQLLVNDLSDNLRSNSKTSYSLILGHIRSINANDTFFLEPSVFIKKIEGLDTELDINAKFYHKPLLTKYSIWYGTSYKTFINDGLNSASLTFFAGIDYKNFNFGYSVDLDTSTKFNNFYNSHQFILGINLFEKRYASLGCSPLNF
ncbi:PorP/SprF family type IX secretion system membrane protein [Tenacibaculum jejuense]|uniref:Type IX secretion system membrane protein, PorP/SprF family n=1 Tax=Tenacibaculum jejuense TaxID=584609 RepID=A0A238U9N8_9FLAO|nr:type IX secretion system membrane protein PorP/SprF [Tenacibaculum jejuense]SNR15130.1 Protein of unknown function precursor [Tenacibaculum jejuense]